MLGSGMEGGMNETYARLDELLERLAERLSTGRPGGSHRRGTSGGPLRV